MLLGRPSAAVVLAGVADADADEHTNAPPVALTLCVMFPCAPLADIEMPCGGSTLFGWPALVLL